jgi:hypothetical protein
MRSNGIRSQEANASPLGGLGVSLFPAGRHAIMDQPATGFFVEVRLLVAR